MRDTANGIISKFKGRWVILQKKDLDYKETFAPVGNLVTLRILLAKVAAEDLELNQADVISAFLNGKIDTLVFLTQAEGFTLGAGFCLIHRSIYGLCQAARV